MSVVVGYVPSPEGEAALEHAMREVAQRDTRLVVVNTSRGDALVDQRYAQPDQVRTLEEKLDAAGLEHVLQHAIRGRDAAENAEPFHGERHVQSPRAARGEGDLEGAVEEPCVGHALGGGRGAHEQDGGRRLARRPVHLGVDLHLGAHGTTL